MYSQFGKGHDGIGKSLNKNTKTGGTAMSPREIEELVNKLFEEMDKKNHPDNIHEKAKANKKKKFTKA
jgi:hypothetical protein